MINFVASFLSSCADSLLNVWLFQQSHVFLSGLSSPAAYASVTDSGMYFHAPVSVSLTSARMYWRVTDGL